MDFKGNLAQSGQILKSESVVVSPQTQELLKVMMEKSKLTSFQKNQIRESMKDGCSLPLSCNPTSSCSKQKLQKQQAHVKVKNQSQFSSGKRKKEVIDLICEKDNTSNLYVPKPGKIITEDDKELLQNKMAYGRDFKQFKKMQKKSSVNDSKPSEEIDCFDAVLQEIEERRQFLNEMKNLGQERNYILAIETEISQKIRELELIDKKRSQRLEKALVEKKQI